MANTKEFKEIKTRCFEAYLGGMTAPQELAVRFGISPVTVRKWISSGKWESSRREEDLLNKDIAVAHKRALLTALKEYKSNPQNQSLQSLVGLLKAEEKRLAPSKELNDHIVLFMDQVTDFMIDKGLIDLLKQYQGIVAELSEYLRMRNNG